jgi:uncharacterized protein
VTLLAALLAILVGLLLGLLGGGGSVLTVPVLTYALHIAPKLAIAMSLGIVALTSLVGAVPHWRAGHVALRTAFIFGPAAVIGAIAGARVARLLSATTQMAIFGVVVLIGAVMMWRSASTVDAPPQTAKSGAEQRSLLLILEGGGVGMLTSIIGVGGGFLIVPALVSAASLPMRTAIGTSLVIISMNAASGFASYLTSRMQMPWALIMGFAALAIVGSLIGARLARRVPVPTLKRTFAGLLVLMAFYVLYRR